MTMLLAIPSRLLLPFLLCLLIAEASFAQSQSFQLSPETKTQLVKPKSKASSNLELSLELLESQYFTDPIDSTNQGNSYTYLNPRLVWSATNFKTDLRGVVALNDKGDNHFYFPEIWHQLGDLTFGRKLLRWSHLDDQFKIGLWQPLFRWDHARSQSLGLTGVFYQKEINNYARVTAMLSPLFLPDQQPDYKIEDGKMVSGNRWVRNPIDSIPFLQNSTDLKYNVVEPAVDEVIFNPSAAIMFELGEDYGPWALASWTRKPNNQFHLGVDIGESYDPRSDELNPKIYPVIVNHELLSLETGYRGQSASFYVSVTQENYSQPDLPSVYVQTELVDNRYFGAVFEHSLPSILPGHNSLVWSIYERSKLGQEEGDIRIEGAVSASTQRIAFKRWQGLDYILNLNTASAIQFRFGYKYSNSDKGEWISSDLVYGVTKQLSLSATLDFFGADINSDEPSFISYYSNNDRAQLGLKYVF